MPITDKTDKEILAIALPMIDTVINACNRKDWEAFSVYQTEAEAKHPENQANMLKAWDEVELFSSLSLEREVLGVIRNDGIAQILWKQCSNKASGEEYLARYFIKEIEGEIKEVGFLISFF
ncbi:hypothetical protein [uncultured Pseudoteredinibacter sp.]|uniref:hypothetical protein n=1 Tax=uncultured Pseudoteredinibacter sp. TaxID=1641701 RepID=UPI00260F2153|nr:hypothetical protein [uncultured Pseudoteredinibacter sp.]